MTPLENRFPKKEHLCGETTIENLYATGTSFFSYPLRVTYGWANENERVPLRCLVAVSKRKFKHAVDRNRVKRQMREGYRKSKLSLYHRLDLEDKHLYVAFQFVGQKIESTNFIQKRMEQMLLRIEEETLGKKPRQLTGKEKRAILLGLIEKEDI